MELTALQQLVHQMYIAYYQRPADPEGLQYWVEQLEQNGDWSTVSAAFGAPENTENQALYGDLTREETIAAIYQSAFNRAAVEAEVQFWAESEFSATDLTFAIVNGAQNDDLTTVNNKVEFSALLVQQVETNAAFAQLEDPKALLAAVTAETTVNAEYVSSAVASGTTGETFSLTADGAGEVFVGTANNDTFNAASGALEVTTIDGQGGNDTLNATYKTTDFGFTPTIRNVENINVDIDAFGGGTTTFNATNVRGSTITLSSTKLGFNGTASVAAAAANSVTAGANVTDLTVGSLTTGTVNAGSANAVSITGTAGNNVALTVNGDTTLDVATADGMLNVNSTADSVINVAASGDLGALTGITGSGTGAITFAGNAADFTGDTISGVSLNINAGGPLNAENFNLTGLEVSANSLVVNNAQSQVVDLTSAGAALTLNGTAAASESATVNVAANQTGGTLTFSALESSTVNVGTGVTNLGTLAVGDANTTVNVVSDLTVGSITVADTETVTVAGTGNVTVTTATAARTVDASGLTGALDLDSSLAALVSANVSISGATGNNKVDFANNTATTTYVGQSGNDTVTSLTEAGAIEATFAGGDNSVTANSVNTGTLSVTGGAGKETISATGLTTGTVAGALGAGDDSLTLGGGVFGASTIAVDFGAGNDTLVLGASANLTAASFNVVGLENITVDTAATFTAAQLSGKDFNIASATGGATLTVNGSGNADMIDLSGLTLSTTVGSDIKATINGNGGNDTIIGTNAADTIDGGAGVDTITLGGGSDTVVVGTVTAGGIDIITDFSSADTIQFTSPTVAVDNYVNATATNYDTGNATLVDALTAVASAQGTAGLDSSAIAFVYGGNTYALLTADNTYAAGDDAVVQITGTDASTLSAADFLMA